MGSPLNSAQELGKLGLGLGRSYFNAHVKLVEVAKANGIALKQTFEREGKYLTHKAGRYGHAKQFRRMRKVIKRQGTIVGRLSREIARKANTLSEAVQEALMQPLGRANRIRLQVKQGKNTKGPKIYRLLQGRSISGRG